MKILFILEYYHPHIGGVERLFKSLVDRLTIQGHEVLVLTNKYDKRLLSFEKDGNVTIRRFRFYNRYLFTFFACIPGLSLAKGVDFIHTTSYNAAMPAWIVGTLRKKKVIITFHEYWGQLWDELPWMSRFSRFLHRSFERMLRYLPFDQFIAVSDFTKEALINAGIHPDKIKRIYNGIDYSEDWRSYRADLLSNEIFTFTFFGRVGYSKGLNILIEAAYDLKQKGRDFILQLIVPQEPLLEKIEELLTDMNLKGQVRFYHELPKEVLFSIIGQSDAVVIPSYSEGFCFAAVETMAIGTPILSSGRGALKEVIGGEYIEITGLSAQCLSEGMQQAMDGEWTVGSEKLFPLDRTIEQYIQLYTSLLQNH